MIKYFLYLFYLFLFCLYIRNKNKIEGACFCENGTPAPSASPACTPSPSLHYCIRCNNNEYELSEDNKCYIPKKAETSNEKFCELTVASMPSPLCWIANQVKFNWFVNKYCDNPQPGVFSMKICGLFMKDYEEECSFLAVIRNVLLIIIAFCALTWVGLWMFNKATAPAAADAAAA